ncbi:hypothetical protein KPA96_13690 [Burkholderia cenocepacia]|uniref:hypothetical protein n=1 Tax=Burkholderia cenocepacia TaxID=95486 RepID=UPI00285E75A6|nr:hypothetical protein [Burkholderia cenocepacia]MCB4346805.1 hypothetical protein [Burkholderia vietnamiensis]MDR8076709.1 hypothetical protein [Burkholderia cenocepacia]
MKTFKIENKLAFDKKLAVALGAIVLVVGGTTAYLDALGKDRMRLAVEYSKVTRYVTFTPEYKNAKTYDERIKIIRDDMEKFRKERNL